MDCNRVIQHRQIWSAFSRLFATLQMKIKYCNRNPFDISVLFEYFNKDEMKKKKTQPCHGLNLIGFRSECSLFFLALSLSAVSLTMKLVRFLTNRDQSTNIFSKQFREEFMWWKSAFSLSSFSSNSFFLSPIFNTKWILNMRFFCLLKVFCCSKSSLTSLYFHLATKSKKLRITLLRARQREHLKWLNSDRFECNPNVCTYNFDIALLFKSPDISAACCVILLHSALLWGEWRFHWRNKENI